MKKLLFLVMLALASFQLNAQDYSSVNYIQKYGQLQLKGLQLSSESGEAVQFRGWSTFGLQWQVSCYNKNAFEQMKAWGANIVRLAMYVFEGGAQSNMDNYISKVEGFIDDCESIGIYVLVDWHVLTPGNPNDYLDNRLNGKGAQYFFKAISSYCKQKNYKHVLYEICNEPNDGGWSAITSFANEVIPCITQNQPNAIIVCGTPQWDQRPEDARDNPLKLSGNIMYSFHYYACSHVNFLGTFKNCCGKIPMFVTEWGPVRFDGDGDFCEGNADLLMAACDGGNDGKQKVSWCCWNWGDKQEASSALKTCSDFSQLTKPGSYVKNKLCGTGECKTIVLTGGPYGGSAQKIPNDLFQVAYYDLGGEGVAYHDGDGSDFEQGIAKGDCKNDVNCNAGYCYAETQWSFREGECVDVSGCYGVDGDYASYNLGTRENDEWLIYTVDVQEPAYYSIEFQATKSTSGSVEFTVEKDGESWGNAVYNTATEKPFTGVLSFDAMTECSEANDWQCWEWQPILASKDKNPALLFKESGLLQLKMFFPTEGGDLGPLRFKKVKDYTGTGYVSSEAVKSEESFTIYPNPTTGAFNIALSGCESADVEVINSVGQVVYAAKINNNAEIDANLAAGPYVVKIQTANKFESKKLIVK